VEQVAAATAKKLILVVDDEPDIRLIIRMVLERQGYSVLEASNGQSALDLLESQGQAAVSCVITGLLDAAHERPCSCATSCASTTMSGSPSSDDGIPRQGKVRGDGGASTRSS